MPVAFLTAAVLSGLTMALLWLYASGGWISAFFVYVLSGNLVLWGLIARVVLRRPPLPTGAPASGRRAIEHTAPQRRDDFFPQGDQRHTDHKTKDPVHDSFGKPFDDTNQIVRHRMTNRISDVMDNMFQRAKPQLLKPVNDDRSADPKHCRRADDRQQLQETGHAPNKAAPHRPRAAAPPVIGHSKSNVVHHADARD